MWYLGLMLRQSIALTQTVCEMIWMQSLLCELGFVIQTPIAMYCNNQAAIFIANNPIFHERTKHIEVDYHYIRDMVLSGHISTPYTQTSEQLADVFTKSL